VWQRNSIPVQCSQSFKWSDSGSGNEGPDFEKASHSCGIGIWMPSETDINAPYHWLRNSTSGQFRTSGRRFKRVADLAEFCPKVENWDESDCPNVL
jgi:hypothetical protein